MSYFQLLYDRNKYIRKILKKMGFSRPIELEFKSSRIIEYPWVLRNIPSDGRVLDVGSTGSILPLKLISLGYEVWTIDIRQYEHEGISNNLHCIKGDIRKTNFPHSFFDIVLAVSSIEHIGLGRYGDPIDREGDKNALKEIRKIMTNKGILLMTVPFGKNTMTKFHRAYNLESLLALLREFNIVKIDYFVRTDRIWKHTSIEQAIDIDSSLQENAIACVMAIKSL